MNSVTIAGIVGNDAELKFLPTGDAVCNFSVADSQGKEKPTIWHRMQIFGRRAESLSKWLTKGVYVTVSGQLTQREYTDRDGVKKMAQEIRVQDVALQGGQRQEASERPAKEPSQREKNLARQHAASRGDDFQDTDLSEVPF